ncbi:MAG: hypothetical protein NUV69_02935 [Candidatus Curtissbacteria bacterium]|nr:hypothetical protein [Candidatus Curtissbacteria bacterium]
MLERIGEFVRSFKSTSNPEAPQRSDLIKAAKSVFTVYRLEFHLRDIEELDEVTNNHRWTETAKNNPVYSEKILELQQALKKAQTAQENAPEDLRNLVQNYFPGTRFAYAPHLLIDILWARSTSSEGRLNRRVDRIVESRTMFNEMGIRNSNELKDIKPETVIAYVLTGRLKLTTQTDHSYTDNNRSILNL